MQHIVNQTILLVEANVSLRRMIALSLRYHGLRVIEAGTAHDLPDLHVPPALVLLDIDSETGSESGALADIERHPLLSALPVVVLSWDAALPAASDRQDDVTPAEHHAYMAKPFDARALHTIIESLLLPGNAARDPRLAVNLPAGRSASTTAPSLCPILAAAGLMLALIGFMMQLVVTACGVLIIVVALLWWTLGPRPEALAVAS